MANDIEKKYRPFVIIISVVVPILVAGMFRLKIEGVDTSYLPPIYASINGLTAILLVMAVISIRKKKIELHRTLMTSAVICSMLFLAGYVAYHITSDSTLYGDLNGDSIIDPTEQSKISKAGMYSYYLILLTHILLSIAVIPLVLFTYLKGWADNRESHRKWAKFTFPIWLYVAVSGVVVYLMISPYY